MSLIRRSSAFLILSALVACAPFRDAASNPDASVPVEGGASFAMVDSGGMDAGVDGDGTPPNDPFSLLLAARSLVVTPDSSTMYVAGTRGIFQVQLPTSGPVATIAPFDADVTDATALAWDDDTNNLLFITPHSIGRLSATHPTTDMDTHPNVTGGHDIRYASRLVLGSFSSEVTSFTDVPVFGDIHTLSGDDSAPLGIDTTDVDVFWADARAVFAAPLDRSTGAILVASSDDAPNSVAYGNDGYLYIAEGTKIERVQISADGAVTNDPVLFVDANQPTSLVVKDGYAYWLQADGSLWSASTTTAAKASLAFGKPITGNPQRCIQVDANYVYWVQPTDGSVNRIAKPR